MVQIGLGTIDPGYNSGADRNVQRVGHFEEIIMGKEM